MFTLGKEDKKKKEEEKKRKEEEKKKKEEEEKKRKKEEEKKKGSVKKIVVDLWKTGLHGAEIGIREKETRMSKSRQFTRDMDLIGAVEIDGEKAGHVGMRKDPWELPKGAKKEDEYKRRLIIKAFNESGSWKGTIEELLGWEIKNSVSVGEPQPAFMCVVSGTKYITMIEKLHTRWRANYSMQLIDDSENVGLYTIKADRFSLGSDWYIEDVTGKKVAEVDGKVLDIGGEFEIKIFDEQLGKNTVFVNTLKLFAATLKYLDDIEDKIGKTVDGIRKGYKLELEKSEIKFFKNPRLIRV